MSLLHVLSDGVADRARRVDVSAWQKAREMAELQRYLRSEGHSHSTRDLATLTKIPQTRVAEQLTIANELDQAELARYGITPEEISAVHHRTLLRIAKLPGYLRDKPLRDCLRQGGPASASLNRYIPRGERDHRRAAVYAKMLEEGQFRVEVIKPVGELTQSEAREYLDDMLPAVAHLAEVSMIKPQGYYMALTGNGGILVYLPPTKT